MSDQKFVQCEVVYDGPSYPQYHGTRCASPKGHDDEKNEVYLQRHRAYPCRGGLGWYTPEQKKRLYPDDVK